ncbi:MAG: M23 family metallopeptidase [Enhydrobacter sp.]|nr:M23 family metallopeptidase [Enhydrobacter sp.]
MLENAVNDRVQAIQERDEATAMRDATLIETRKVLRQLDAETRATIADIEKIIVATGLEPSRVVPEPNRIRRVGARGGPYIPWKAQVALAEHSESSQLQTLTQQLEKLKALRDVMVRLPLVAPVTHAILSDGFGYRRDPVNGGGARHEGLDLRAVRDSAVIAPAAGTVVAAGWDGAFGNLIQIDHGFGVVSRYAHLSRMLVRKGDVVARNEQIGVVGATGRATGVHLHYEIWVDGQPRDPMRFLTAVSRPVVGFVHQ